MMRGECAPLPTRFIVERLSGQLPTSRLMVLEGAGHMGPLTHAPEVSSLIVQHIAAAEAPARRERRPRSFADMLDAPPRSEAAS